MGKPVGLWRIQLKYQPRSALVARSSIYRCARWFEEGGTTGLFRGRGGRAAYCVTNLLLEQLEDLLDETPRKFGYLRRTWSSELLASALRGVYGIVIHPSTVRRAL